MIPYLCLLASTISAACGMYQVFIVQKELKKLREVRKQHENYTFYEHWHNNSM